MLSVCFKSWLQNNVGTSHESWVLLGFESTIYRCLFCFLKQFSMLLKSRIFIRTLHISHYFTKWYDIHLNFCTKNVILIQIWRFSELIQNYDFYGSCRLSQVFDFRKVILQSKKMKNSKDCKYWQKFRLFERF